MKNNHKICKQFYFLYNFFLFFGKKLKISFSQWGRRFFKFPWKIRAARRAHPRKRPQTKTDDAKHPQRAYPGREYARPDTKGRHYAWCEERQKDASKDAGSRTKQAYCFCVCIWIFMFFRNLDQNVCLVRVGTLRKQERNSLYENKSPIGNFFFKVPSQRPTRGFENFAQNISPWGEDFAAKCWYYWSL